MESTNESGQIPYQFNKAKQADEEETRNKKRYISGKHVSRSGNRAESNATFSKVVFASVLKTKYT